MDWRKSMLAAVWVGMLAVGVGAAWAAEGTITTAGLMSDMTDLSKMAEFPSPAYTCKQFSSYDRAAKSPTDNWFANGDCGQYLRVEDRNGRKEYVMMDTAGPGAIVRIWSANPAGTLRIYIDGNEKPVIEAAMSEVLGGKFPGWPRPIAGEYSKGWNLYFPIPYAKSCKVTSDKGDFYYHVNYRTYAEGTKVESFEVGQIKALAGEIEKLAKRLGSPRGDEAEMAGQAQPFEVQLGPGEATNTQFAGSQAVVRCMVMVDASDKEAALRGVIFKATFDGEQTVEVPLGDFFGSAPGINAYESLPLGMAKDGKMYCHWFMPFKESAEFRLENTTKMPVTISGEIAFAEYKWTDASMHFCAKWRAQFDVPTRPMQDWNYMTAKGHGVFAGVAFAIDNPVKDWWGEGDEKIYVDGEKFPSHFGTGTEDYYGYAWCWPGLFVHAYHNQPRCDGPGNYGRTSVNRFHIVDRIPYTKDFKFDMELWHWNEKCKVNMAVVSYWYARPGGTDGFKPIKAEDAIVRPMAEWKVPKVAGAIEGEGMRIIKKVGNVEPQDWGDESGGRHLWWNAGHKPGDVLVLGFEAPKAGRYRVMGKFLKAADYGIHQLAVNGKKAGEPIDFYNNGVVATKEIDLGVFELKQGENELSVTVVGVNAQAVKAYMFGLDYVLLKAE